ncbi:MAG: hypothetical protein NVS2B17_09810 [Candidatus Velthaea sp.]
MNWKRLLGPLVIVVTLSLAGFAQPLLDRARAAETDTRGTTPAGAPGQIVPSGGHISSSLGTENAGELPPDALKGYGPVDQAKPLDFSHQPATVPRVYAGGKLYNVQVLKKYNYTQLLNQMNYYTQSLGVQCTYCHNVQNFAYDTPTKKIARTMQIMSNEVASAWVEPVKHDYPNFSVNGAVGCATCHRGAARMGVQYNVVPVQYLDYPAKSTKQAGYVVNSMYSASKSLGVNCLFCHNSADFISLQYYPTNQIAHRMWAMVDKINHQYLPANVKAVTCYTCHHGAKWPQALVSAGLDQTPVEAIAAHPEVHENPGAHLASGALH